MSQQENRPKAIRVKKSEEASTSRSVVVDKPSTTKASKSNAKTRQSYGGQTNRSSNKRPSSSASGATSMTLPDMWGLPNSSFGSLDSSHASSSSGANASIAMQQPPAKRSTTADQLQRNFVMDGVSPHPNLQKNTSQKERQTLANVNRANVNRQKPTVVQEMNDDDIGSPEFRMKIGRHHTTHRATPRLPHTMWGAPQEVWNVMCSKEVHYTRCSTRVARLHTQIAPRMRSILVDWMAEVCEVYRMQRSTYHLAVDTLDRFLSKCKAGVLKRDLQLVGVTALFTASKIEEIYPPKLPDFAYVTDGACSEESILKMELIVLTALNWAMAPTTAVTWMATYLQIDACQDEIEAEMGPNGSAANGTTARRSLFDSGKSAASSSSEEVGDENSRWSTGMMPSSEMTGCLPNHAKADLWTSPRFDRETFVQLCQLLDLCMMDMEYMDYAYSVIAASCIYLMVEESRLALCLSGYRMDDISKCVAWMRPFARCIGEQLPVGVPYHESIIASEQHNIQPHVVTVAPMFDRVQQLRTPFAVTKKALNEMPTPPTL